ncbi:15561_t:CDS:2 [Funneliformis geosporum]|uniref:15561_t:CDS:1 n=1 Tax=Funneliformis geosporum TaxID=1117311 RepID=A0A9W4SJL2_9GLOM|nr:15561_t:CDS:2 [Funneliformis geosporum]
MTNLIKGTELDEGEVEITDEREELTWSLKRDQDGKYISPIVSINQQHIESKASFLECIRYFEDISSIETNAYSSPPKSDHGNSQEDLDSSNSDHSDHDSGDDYKPKTKRRKVNNSEVKTWIN